MESQPPLQPSLAPRSPANSTTAKTEQPQDLKQEISTIVEPYRHLREKPPFSTAELIVIAVVCFSGHPAGATAHDLLHYIIHEFRYFTDKLIEAYTSKEFDRIFEAIGKQDEYLGDIVEGFWRALGDYEVPLTVNRYQDGGEHSYRYTVKLSEARVFLRNILEPVRKGVFDFMELPSEIRNTICEYILELPGKDGLTIVYQRNEPSYFWRDWNCMFLVGMRANGSTARISPGHSPTTRLGNPNDGTIGICAPAMKDLLAILSVCKQIYREVMSMFYRLNHVRFHGLGAIEMFLLKGPSTRLQHLTSVGITLNTPGDFTTFPATVQKLASLSHLRELTIGMYSEPEWLDMFPSDRRSLGWRIKRKFRTFDDIPGMLDLAELVSNLQVSQHRVHIQGNCGNFRAFMAAQMAVLQAQVGGTATEKRARAKKAAAKAKKNGA
ncbi:Hypothetical predicted protein [Lecanosticta acicola]|uniref:Uncharacterized protein n=1 Tax=Lecanosticta acicola TaxID=111012 RepID=A0AAI8YUX7_9PEZI|nr:Hypothetical predicted protein [Lecanosticta acicola]